MNWELNRLIQCPARAPSCAGAPLFERSQCPYKNKRRAVPVTEKAVERSQCAKIQTFREKLVWKDSLVFGFYSKIRFGDIMPSKPAIGRKVLTRLKNQRKRIKNPAQSPKSFRDLIAMRNFLNGARKHFWIPNKNYSGDILSSEPAITGERVWLGSKIEEIA